MRIAILSRSTANYSTRVLIDAAEKAGHEVIVLDYAKCYMEIEHNRPTIHYKGERLRGIDAVIPRIGFSYTGYGSAVVRQFEMMNVFTTAKSIAIVRSRDKLRSLQLMARSDIDIPKTAFASQTEDITELIELVGGAPLIVKLVESTHGQGVVLAQTKKEAKSIVQAFYSINQPILIQEFIEESGGADIRAFVVGGRVVGAMKRQGLDEDFRSNLHLGGTGEKIKLSDDERKIAVKAAKKLGLDIAGVDILQSSRGPLVIEVNSSPGLEGIENTTNKDIASIIVKYIEVNATRKPKKDKVGA
ncbi:MAG: 30S ribosomal protein S6--L-glutamate ligase [Candidatus Saccharimonadales bacterium]